MKINRIMLSDSYKYSHTSQYPTGSESMFCYMEARSDRVYDKTVFFGLQYIIQKYFSTPIEMWEVDEAESFAKMHGEPFDRIGWDYIVNECKGYLPIRIKAVKEGSVIPNHNVLMTIESTDKNVFWIPSFLETLLMKVWYSTTIATKSYFVKQLILSYLKETGTPESIGFKYHNFGDRGSSSVESAAIGGMAHLTQFKGTDNFNSLRYAKEYYDCDMAGFSIPATEHSTVTSHGKEGRFNMYEQYIENFKSYAIIACVMDSYDIFEDTKYITTGSFKKKIESENYPFFVIRPDSGNPVEVLNALLNIMEENSVAYTINEKGYKVFKKYGFIWGDGITPATIKEILEYVIDRGYSADIISFGSGGDLMQNINRDTLGFAIKCSSITVNGIEREVFKNPVTDHSKVSKKGVLDLIMVEGEYVTVNGVNKNSVLQVVYENGVILNKISLTDIRDN